MDMATGLLHALISEFISQPIFSQYILKLISQFGTAVSKVSFGAAFFFVSLIGNVELW
jgi:hypothetical protein